MTGAIKSAESPSVFVVDDEPFQLLFLGGILRTSGYRVETFERPEALLARISDKDRGCVVVDQEMPGVTGVELQKMLMDQGTLLPLIFVSGRAGVPAAVTAMKQGALDFLSKPVDSKKFLAAVAAALACDEKAAAERSVRERAKALWAGLSPREREVCGLVAKGLLNKQIASELGITEGTVQSQRSRAFQKLRVSTTVELIQLRGQAAEKE